MNELYEKLEKIEKNLLVIEEKLNNLLNNSTTINENTNKMSHHIDFIESIYETVKSPLNSICNTVKYYTIKGPIKGPSQLITLPSPSSSYESNYNDTNRRKHES